MRNENPYEWNNGYTQDKQQIESLGQYTAKTFLWMVLGLLVTVGVAVACWSTGFTIYSMQSIPYIHLIVLIATLALSVTMSARIEKMAVGTARTLFIVFSALFGFTLSIYLLFFELTSIISVFAMTAIYFAGLAAYGYFTHQDLTALGSILFSGLIFLIVVGILSIFLPFPSAIDRIVCLIGIAIFLGYTAYDTQKIKSYYQYYANFPDMLEKASVFSALQLYLDFINLLLYLLRFLGNQRRN